MEPIQKNLSDITRKDWIAFHWNEVTDMSDTDRVFVRVAKKTPAEAMQAMEEWDVTAEELKDDE
jgi:hypothetical protein